MGPVGRTSPRGIGLGDQHRNALAYALALGQIYVNLKGREPGGIVLPGAEYEALIAELIAGLHELIDPTTGERVVDQVWRKEELYSGPYLDQAPDLNIVMKGLSYSTQFRREFAMDTVFAMPHDVTGFHRPDGILIAAGPGIRKGVEVSGGHNYGGYHYSLAVINQSTNPNGPPGAGPNVSPIVGTFSDSNFKDLYGRFQYRFNLEKDPASRNDIQAAGANGPRDHTYLQLGGYYFYGRSVQRVQGETSVLTAREPFYRAGGDFSFNYRTFNLFGLYMYGHDKNLVLNGTGDGFVTDPTPAHFNGGFLEADYLALPWLMTIMRYDRVQSTADFVNGGPNYFQAASATRNRVTPGVQFLIHANIKASFEYQIRPPQTFAVGSPAPQQRTNQAVAGLEWVY